jgi:hypothetical protein
MMKNIKAVLAASALAALVVLVAACAPPSNTPNATNIAMEATDSGCNPDEIETEQGNIMNIVLKNSTTQQVTFSFPSQPYSFVVAAGQTTTGNFVAPTVEGRYPFTCGPTDGGGNTTEGQIRVR